MSSHQQSQRQGAVTNNTPALDDVLRRITGSRTILVAASDAPSPDYDVTLDVAVGVAHQLGAKLVLVDRSRVTFGETPHSEGPLSDERAASSGRSHLVERARAARAAGVREVELWTTSMPTVGGVADVAMIVQPVVVVVPAAMQHPSLVERITLRDLTQKVIDSGRSSGRVFHIIAVGSDGGLQLVQ
jgi:hypothetical protein